MPEPRVGYYMHHHGSGHATRALAITRQLECPVTLIGSGMPEGVIPAGIDCLQLPMDVAPGMQVESFDTLHYAPLAVDGLRERMGLLAAWFQRSWPCLLVVDVSVEVAMLARLFGVPSIYIRQHGYRTDLAHRQAYQCATRLLAPFPGVMESIDTPPEIRIKTRYAGWISRYLKRPPIAPERGRVFVINGRGGTAFSYSALAELGQACPGYRFRVAGEVRGEPPAEMPENMVWLGELPEPLEEFCRAEIVIGSAGDGLVAEAASLGCRYIAVAEARPYDEQRAQARRLSDLGVAIGLDQWPQAQEWPSLLNRVDMLPADYWMEWARPQSAQNAADIIQSTLDDLFKNPLTLD